MSSSTEALTKAVRRIFRPLVRLLLRHGVSFAAASDLLAETYISVANEDFEIDGRKQSVSRVSTLTGLSRKKVAEVLKAPEIDLGAASQQYNRAARVLTGWIREATYLDQHKKPLVLSFEGQPPSFTDLVQMFSGDIPPRAIADELIRVGAIKKLASGKLKLVERAYVPAQMADEKINILGTDVANLIQTIDHNIYANDTPFFQRKVAYDAIPESALPDLREVLKKIAQQSLEKMDQILASHDADLVVPPLKDAARRLGVGIYYFEEENDDPKI